MLVCFSHHLLYVAHVYDLNILELLGVQEILCRDPGLSMSMARRADQTSPRVCVHAQVHTCT